MPEIGTLLARLKAKDLPEGAVDLLDAIGEQATTLIADRDDLRNKVKERQAENDKFKTRAQDAETKVKELQEQLPGDDAVILTGDDAKLFDSYKGLGQPEELKLKVTGYDRAISEANQLKTRTMLDQAARNPEDETQYRYKPTVLGDLVKLRGAQLEQKDDAFIVKDDSGEHKLDEWIQADGQKDFLPALTPQQQSGTRAVGQAGNRQGNTGSTLEQIKQRKAQSGDYSF